MKRVFDSSKHFFLLEDKIKEKYSLDQDRFHGFIGASKELFDSKSKQELRESFNVSILDPKLLPSNKEAPGFAQSLIDISHLSTELMRRILKALAAYLTQNSMAFVQMFQSGFSEKSFTTLRSLYYPPILTNNEDLVRLGAHTDYGPLTLLFQDKVGGLEVFSPNVCKWIEATPKDEALLLNAGDLLEILTSGHIPAAL